ncbi:MAG: hypothetical protein ACYTFQ_30930, partial [Planctomycetota bacterium]
MIGLLKRSHITFFTLLLIAACTLTAAPARSAVFRLDGDFFTPSPASQIRTWDIPVPDGRVFTKIVVDIDVTHGGWWANNPDGVHNLFWLTRNGKWRSNTVGYVNLFGPGRNLLKQMTNLELARGEVQAKTSSFTAQKGHAYHVRYSYDCAAGRITTVVTENGNRKAQVQMEAAASEIRTVGGFYQFWIGLEEKHNESPTAGWTYSNLRVEFVPAETGGRELARGPLSVHPRNGRY